MDTAAVLDALLARLLAVRDAAAALWGFLAEAAGAVVAAHGGAALAALLGFVLAASFAAAFLALGNAPPQPAARLARGLHRAGLRAEGLLRALPAPAAAKPDVSRELPEMLDIVNLGLAAGLSFDASLAEYCAVRDSALARSLGEAQLKWRMGLGTRNEVLAGLSRELDEPSFSRFASAVTDSLEMGTPLASTLARQAKLARDEQRAAVEERIEKAPVKMLVPMGSLVVPALLLAIVGPLVAAIGGKY